MSTQKTTRAGTVVPTQTIISRINRRLAREGERLKTLRGERGLSDLVRHYIVDTDRNAVLATHVEPAQLARELHVLRPGERLAE